MIMSACFPLNQARPGGLAPVQVHGSALGNFVPCVPQPHTGTSRDSLHPCSGAHGFLHVLVGFLAFTRTPVQVDVLVGVHGSALTNAEFMRRGSSLIELRPFGFSGRESWPNIYMKVQSYGSEGLQEVMGQGLGSLGQ